MIVRKWIHRRGKLILIYYDNVRKRFAKAPEEEEFSYDVYEGTVYYRFRGTDESKAKNFEVRVRKAYPRGSFDRYDLFEHIDILFDDFLKGYHTSNYFRRSIKGVRFIDGSYFRIKSTYTVFERISGKVWQGSLQ